MKNSSSSQSSYFSFFARTGFMRLSCIMALVALMLGLSACSVAQQPAERGILYGKKWYLISMDRSRHEDIPKYRNFTLTIGKNRLSGNAYNSFSVNANVFSDGAIQVGRNLTTTRMMTMGRERFLEKLYFSSILSAQKWNKVRGKLILSTRQGKLIFRQ